MTTLPPQIVQDILEGPALPAPPGTTSNFLNPPNENYWFIVTLTVTIALSTVAVLIRIYTRFFLIKQRGLEDYTCVLGYLMFIGYGVVAGLLVRHGGGIHQWNLRAREAIKAAFYINACAIVYGITILILKFSVLLQYRRIFVPTKKTDYMYWGTHLMTAIIFIYYIIVTFFEIFECNPREKAWDPLIRDGHCFDTFAIIISAGYFNAVTDFIILFLPQGVIWRLHMPLQKKFAISGVFLVGLFGCVTSIIRLYHSIRLKQTGDEDITYNIMITGFWTHAEIASCILCGCLPMLPKFIQNMGKSLSGLSTSNSSFVRIILSPWTLVRLSQDSDSHQTTKHTWNSGSTRRSLEPLKSPYKEIDDIELAEHGRYQAENTGHKQIFKHVDIQVSHQSGGLRLFESQREKEQPWASKQSAV